MPRPMRNSDGYGEDGTHAYATVSSRPLLPIAVAMCNDGRNRRADRQYDADVDSAADDDGTMALPKTIATPNGNGGAR